MDKTKIRSRPLNVKNVREAMLPYSEEQMYNTVQILQMFDVAPKLERTMWAILKAEHERRKAHAEKLGEARNKIDGKAKKRRRGGTTHITEPEPMPAIRKCECGGMVTGMKVPGCEATATGRVHYEQCDTCPYWAELIKLDQGYKQITNLTGG